MLDSFAYVMVICKSFNKPSCFLPISSMTSDSQASVTDTTNTTLHNIAETGSGGTITCSIDDAVTLQAMRNHLPAIGFGASLLPILIDPGHV